MNGLDGLIRLNKWKLDEKRLALAELERLAARLRDQLTMLEHEMMAEQKFAAGSIEAGIAYGQYAKGVIARRETLAKSLAEVEGQIRLALDDVAEAFRDLKKFDIVKARRDRELAEKTKRLQQSQLDEMGLQLHRRSSEQNK